jgi:hypothetical protein
MALIEGVAVTEVNTTSHGGVTRYAEVPAAGPRLRCALAGPLSEEIAYGRSDDAGCASDRGWADRCAWQLTRDLDRLDKLVADVRAEVRGLLEHHWADVDALAWLLLERGHLSGVDVRRLLPTIPTSRAVRVARSATDAARSGPFDAPRGRTASAASGAASPAPSLETARA